MIATCYSRQTRTLEQFSSSSRHTSTPRMSSESDAFNHTATETSELAQWRVSTQPAQHSPKRVVQSITEGGRRWLSSQRLAHDADASTKVQWECPGSHVALRTGQPVHQLGCRAQCSKADMAQQGVHPTWCDSCRQQQHKGKIQQSHSHKPNQAQTV